MVEAILVFLAGLLPFDLGRRDPIVAAYRLALEGDPENDEQRLVDAMKRIGVPGIYTEPYDDRIGAALDSWQRRETPRELRRALRDLDGPTR